MTENQEEKLWAGPLLSLVKGLLEAGASIYVLGFAVILIQTLQLNVPAVEALHFQAIVAGLPVWLVLFCGYWLAERLVRRMVGGAPADWRVGVAATVLIVATAGALYAEAHVLLGLRLSAGNVGLVVTSLVFVVSLVFLVLAFKTENARIRPNLTVVAYIWMYSGMALLVLLFATLLYPRLPQSVGGGRPVAVRLLLKDEGVGAVLGGAGGAKGKDSLSEPLNLYLRTSSFLLVRRANDQPLVQVPLDQVRAIVWLDCATH